MKKIDLLKIDSSIVALGAICCLGTIYHGLFFSLNDVLKIADSFAYLQMSHFIGELSSQGLGNGWFGFLYSLPIAIFELFTSNGFLAAKIVNILLLNISAVLLWNISRNILSSGGSLFTVGLLFISPTILHFNIHILSENIYIPLFLGLFLLIQNFISKPDMSKSIWIGILLGLMYLTRAEAFMYMISIGIIALYLLINKVIHFKQFFAYSGVFFVSFFIIISPYLIHLHSLTGEWGLTNKGASNLRQAEMRGKQHMDDAGFERAVAELTQDNSQLIAGFAGGMPYNKPNIEGNLISYISNDSEAFLDRFLDNQLKLYGKNIPELILGKSPSLYYSQDYRFNNLYFAIYSLLALIIFVYGLITLYLKEKTFFLILISFFIPASIFFTLFFTLNRYFLIFLPIFFIIISYGINNIRAAKNTHSLQIIIGAQFISVLLLSTFVYYNTESPKDDHYRLKKTAGIWMQNNFANNDSIKIMERFPIVTHYSGSKTRYITPYTSDIQDVYEYGSYHDIDILVADSMDFYTYRPDLRNILEDTPNNFKKLKKFQNEYGQKVILYQLTK